MTTQFGIHQQYHGTLGKTPGLTTPTLTLADYPHTKHTREFKANPIQPQNLVPLMRQACSPAWSVGLCAWFSFKPLGKPEDWRPYYEVAIQWLRDNKLFHLITFVIWHEPENDMPAKQFVDMFNAHHDILKSINPLALTCHAALSYLYHPKVKGKGIDKIVPSQWVTRADYDAIDAYSGRSWPLGQMLPEMEVFKQWYDAVPGSKSGAWVTTERGFIAAPENDALGAETIGREADWLVSNPIGQLCRVYLAWDTIGAEGDPLIPFGPARKAAMQSLMNRITAPPVIEPEPQPEVKTRTISCPLCYGSGSYSYPVE